MKKIMLIGLLALSSAASVAFAVQSNSSSRKLASKQMSCRKVFLTCPDGSVYYKCILASVSSPECWRVGDGCNITEFPCHGGPVIP